MLRVPYGVVGAISPFNFPLNLVAHKLGPAIAAGNAIVLKPAGQTPISALKLAEILVEAGLPEGWLSVIPGPGSRGRQRDRRARADQGAHLHRLGQGRLGHPQPRPPQEGQPRARLQRAADRPRRRRLGGGRRQSPDPRLLPRRPELHLDPADPRPRGRRRRLHRAARRQRRRSCEVGDPLDPETDVGPLITPGDRDRVKEWIDEAVAAGAELLTGGELVDEGRCLAPTLLGSPPHDAKVWCEEIFGPVATIDRFSDFGEALAMANDSKFGLQAGVFTRDIGRGLEAADTLEFGGVLINEVPTFRADQHALRRRQGLRQHPRGPRLRGHRADRGALRHPAGLRVAVAGLTLEGKCGRGEPTRAGGPSGGGRAPPRGPPARRPARARPRAASGPTRPPP